MVIRKRIVKEGLAPKYIPKLSFIYKALGESPLLPDSEPGSIKDPLFKSSAPSHFQAPFPLRLAHKSMQESLSQRKTNMKLCHLYQVPHCSFLFTQLLKRVIYTPYLYSFTSYFLRTQQSVSLSLLEPLPKAVHQLFRKAMLFFIWDSIRSSSSWTSLLHWYHSVNRIWAEISVVLFMAVSTASGTVPGIR